MADLRIDVDGPVAVLTLDRAEQQNTFTGAMGADLETAYRRCDEDEAIRLVAESILLEAGAMVLATGGSTPGVLGGPETS